MGIDNERRRVLIAAGSQAIEAIRAVFTSDLHDQWEAVEADSFSRARFVLQHDPCDLLLVNDDLYHREGGQGLAWLAYQREVPVVFLAGSAVHFQKAYELGANVCLPRHMALEHPLLLATVMEQAIKAGEARLEFRKTKERLASSRHHVDRLVNMIWRTTSRQPEVQWFSQRYMMERLSDELARVERHQVPLTLAIGQVRPTAKTEANVPDLTMQLIARSSAAATWPVNMGWKSSCCSWCIRPLKARFNVAGACKNPSRSPPSRLRDHTLTCMPISASAALRPGRCRPSRCCALPSKISKPPAIRRNTWWLIERPAYCVRGSCGVIKSRSRRRRRRYAHRRRRFGEVQRGGDFLIGQSLKCRIKIISRSSSANWASASCKCRSSSCLMAADAGVNSWSTS